MTTASPYSAVYLTDGLSLSESKKRFQNRRKNLKKKLDAPCLITGVQKDINRGEPWLLTRSPLYQEPLMSFLTGINQVGTALLLNPFGDDILFLPKKDENKEFWEGVSFGCGTEKSEKDCLYYLGFKHIEENNDLRRILNEYVNMHRVTTLSLAWYEKEKSSQVVIKDTAYLFKESIKRYFRKNNPPLLIKNVSSIILSMRLSLDKVDQQNLRVANNKASDAFKTVCQHLSTLSNETEISGLLSGEIIKRSWLGHSFPSIIANGKNAAILHYHANNSPLDPNALLLMDFGLREWHMPSDISRTIPVSGTYNALQKILYNIVLDAQETVEKAVKAGITIQELNDLCWVTLEELLDKRFHDIGGKSKRSYSKQPHNVSHLMGLMVHDGDPYRNYRSMPLDVGMVISNEPGLYGHFEITLNNITFSETIGIRIEDNLLVTKNGCENLTSCPKTINQIESLF